LDCVGSHHTPESLAKCGENNVQVLYILQTLELVTLAILKRKLFSSRFDKSENHQSNKIERMMAAWYQLSAPHSKVMVFENLGLIPFIGPDKHFHLWFDRGSVSSPTIRVTEALIGSSAIYLT
jgi:hypothetical protein